MNVWTSTGFDGLYPVGTAAVVVADTAQEASDILNTLLAHRSMAESSKPEHFQRVCTETPHAIILCDGDY